jgi:hypothetical protein
MLLTMPLNLRALVSVLIATVSFCPSISLGCSARPSVMISSVKRVRTDNSSTPSKAATSILVSPTGLCSTLMSRSFWSSPISSRSAKATPTLRCGQSTVQPSGHGIA